MKTVTVGVIGAAGGWSAWGQAIVWSLLTSRTKEAGWGYVLLKLDEMELWRRPSEGVVVAEMQVLFRDPQSWTLFRLWMLGNSEIKRSPTLSVWEMTSFKELPFPCDLEKTQMPPLSTSDKAKYRLSSSHSWLHKWLAELLVFTDQWGQNAC